MSHVSAPQPRVYLVESSIHPDRPPCVGRTRTTSKTAWRPGDPQAVTRITTRCKDTHVTTMQICVCVYKVRSCHTFTRGLFSPHRGVLSVEEVQRTSRDPLAECGHTPRVMFGPWAPCWPVSRNFCSGARTMREDSPASSHGRRCSTS